VAEGSPEGGLYADQRGVNEAGCDARSVRRRPGLALLAGPAPRGKLLGFCGRGPVLCCAPAVVWRAWAVGVLA
jgi:hypothetical protein